MELQYSYFTIKKYKSKLREDWLAISGLVIFLSSEERCLKYRFLFFGGGGVGAAEGWGRGTSLDFKIRTKRDLKVEVRQESRVSNLEIFLPCV